MESKRAKKREKSQECLYDLKIYGFKEKQDEANTRVSI